MPKNPLAEPVRHSAPLALNQTLSLDPAARAALEFREVNPSEAFTVVDSTGHYFRASLKAPGEALVYEAFAGSPESPVRLTLFCAILGRQRMILVTQKAAELGCDTLVPVLTKHSVQRGKELEKEKPWAWKGQALKGSRQCRRGSVMHVAEPTPFEAALASPEWSKSRASFYLDDRTEGRTVAGEESGDYALFVGPEGGFSDAEREKLAARGTPLRLGARVLRAETAAIVGLAVLQHRLGDLR